MAGLRVFVSSTCYDLAVIREQLRGFISSMGYEPVMSDYNDILYDPRLHTHTSCVDEVKNCDMMVLIVGSRFGGKSVGEALTRVDFSKINKENFSHLEDKDYNKIIDILKNDRKISVTQLEVLKAVEETLPVYCFIENKIWNYHELYERNKENDILDKILFPSIDKQETAQYIFNFINFIRLRAQGNSIFTFTKLEEIKKTLMKQWSSYFQRLLNEQRFAISEKRQLDSLGEQFEDLRTAILSSIGTSNEKEVARGIVRFRMVIDFIMGLKIDTLDFIKNDDNTWDDLLKVANIVNILDSKDYRLEEEFKKSTLIRIGSTFLVRNDKTYYHCRLSKSRIHDISSEFAFFMKLASETRIIIVDALLEMHRGTNFIRHVDHNIELDLDLESAKELVAITTEH